MARITREEVLKLAELSNIAIHEDEIDVLMKQLEDVLNYAARVQEIAKDIDVQAIKNVNVFRDDVVIKSDAQAILACAPEREDNFFVVPSILETTK